MSRGKKSEFLGGVKSLFRSERSGSDDALMHRLFANSFDGILIYGADGTVERMNAAARRLLGIEEDQPSEALFVSRLIRPDPASQRAGHKLDLVTPHPLFEAVAHRQDGIGFPAELTICDLNADEQIGPAAAPRLALFIRDVSERKTQQKRLEHQAKHDPLTGLPNRYRLREEVERAIAAAREEGGSVGLLLADLDRFKEINDTLGHHVGDMLLQNIAERLKASLPKGLRLARLGGDEFAILQPGADRAAAESRAQEVIRALDAPFDVIGLSLQVDTAIGIALFPDHSTCAAELIQRADAAMYMAKRERQGITVYQSERDVGSVRLLTLNGELRKAIDHGDLALHYQPKLAADTDQVVGVEALIRWNHPQHGMIPPDEFMGMAEHTGLIRPLTRFVLETALAQVAAWMRDGRCLSIAVNISARNLLEEDLPQTVGRLLSETDVAPWALTLEITESAIMSDPDRALEVITELSQLGTSISIDDFGTGYSSLGYLKRLPAREIKIDKSFVMEMDRDKDDLAIVRSTIELAHNLGLRVVAEGVERAEVWQALKRLGCDIGQGFLFSRPVDNQSLVNWLKSASVQNVEQAVLP